jgi:hypothetical protein
MVVFEYGSGGSTLFFSGKAGKLISTEHDESWYNVVSKRIPSTAHIELVTPEPNPGARSYTTTSNSSMNPAYAGQDFSNYVRTIDKYADGTFDLVLVDGRARASCIAHAIPKVRKGGYIMLDNSYRPEYADVMNGLLSRYPRKDFKGLVPALSNRFGMTTIWKID